MVPTFFILGKLASVSIFKVKLVIGTSGGSQIISATAQAVIRMLIFNQTVKEAIDAPRFHNQFLPPITHYESSIPKVIFSVYENFWILKMFLPGFFAVS